MTYAIDWHVYLLESDTGRTYVGCTIDLARRLDEHNGIKSGGAKATRGWRPWRISRTWGPFPNRSVAQHVEACIKKLPRKQRYTYIPSV